jgi:hypothetical protein
MDAIFTPAFGKIWSQIVARSWKDDIFKQRVIANPAEVLKEFGYHSNPKVKFKVIEERSSEHYTHLTLPAKPQSKDLEELELKMISAGSCGCDGCGHCV